ncbi:Major Facilitator Superfamily protein [Micromonospora mirobrigensis]|uniref:Major Facilitator Superfamily protein n=1 Tax=Micromonospora mirobrigensis TaxID=262898 RepID=A0A1C4WVS6_9ACTN|nr:Major Facilitator Superfamily protein [Micromonospora mirobrigensis]
MGSLAGLTAAGPLRTIAWSTLVNNAGNGAFAATAVVYLNQICHISGYTIGLGFTVAAVAGLLASVPAGLLADRGDPARLAGALAGGAGLASGLYAVVTGTWSFLVVAVVYALLERGSVIARQTLIGVAFTGSERTAARALLRSVSNVGAALGTGGAALVLALGGATDYRILFAVNAGTYALAGILLSRVRLEPDRADDQVVAPPPGRAPGATVAVLRDRTFAAVSAVNALLTVHAIVLEVVLPLWVVNRTDAPRTVVALLVVVNTVLVILFQLPVSRPFGTVPRAIAGLRVAALLLSAMFLLLFLSSRFDRAAAVGILLVAAAAQTGAEMVQGAASWPLGYDLAPPRRIGEYQGFFGIAEQVVQIAGPAGLTWILFAWDGSGALTLAAGFALLAVAAPPFVRRLVAGRTIAGS